MISNDETWGLQWENGLQDEALKNDLVKNIFLPIPRKNIHSDLEMVLQNYGRFL